GRRCLFEGDVNRGNVCAGWNDVVGHLAVGEIAFAPEAFLVERVPDALGAAALDLPRREDGMDDFTHFLQGMEAGDAGGVGDGIDGDLGDVDGPGVGRVGFAAVGLVIPEDIRRGFVAHTNLEVA